MSSISICRFIWIHLLLLFLFIVAFVLLPWKSSEQKKKQTNNSNQHIGIQRRECIARSLIKANFWLSTQIHGHHKILLYQSIINISIKLIQYSLIVIEMVLFLFISFYWKILFDLSSSQRFRFTEYMYIEMWVAIQKMYQ